MFIREHHARQVCPTCEGHCSTRETNHTSDEGAVQAPFRLLERFSFRSMKISEGPLGLKSNVIICSMKFNLAFAQFVFRNLQVRWTEVEFQSFAKRPLSDVHYYFFPRNPCSNLHSFSIAQTHLRYTLPCGESTVLLNPCGIVPAKVTILRCRLWIWSSLLL